MTPERLAELEVVIRRAEGKLQDAAVECRTQLYVGQGDRRLQDRQDIVDRLLKASADLGHALGELVKWEENEMVVHLAESPKGRRSRLVKSR